jgi:6-phosphogluconate dehydrogenase (decarboxylating)
MDAASNEFGWNLPLPTIAKIWRAGCIIRSQFLGQIAESFSQSTPANLLMAPAFVEMMKKAHPSLRRVVALAAEAGLPVPALSSRSGLFRRLPSGARHIEPDPGAARLLRRAWLRAAWPWRALSLRRDRNAGSYGHEF